MNARRLPVSVKLNYAVGQIGIQMLVAAVGFFLLIFYTDVVLVPPAVASAALLIGKIWYTLTDPVLGLMIDRTQSRKGRRRVYLVYFGWPLAVFSAIVWMVPAGLSPTATFFWIVATYIIYETVHTLVHLPYYAMAAELTADYDDRTSLIAYSSGGALIGFMLGGIAMPLVVKAAPDAATGYAWAGMVFGLVAGACVAWVAWRVVDPNLPSQASRPGSHWRVVVQALRCRPFALLLGGCALGRIGLTMAQGGLAYFVIYQLQGQKSDLPRLLGVLLAVVGLSIPVWKMWVDRWEKHYVYAVGLCLAALGFGVMFQVQAGQSYGLLLGLGLIGLGMGAHWVVPYSMLPDTIDFSRDESHLDQTGLFYGLFGLGDKLARTVGTVAIGWILQGFNYIPNVVQTTESLLGIRLTVGMLPAALVLAAVPPLLMYPVSRARHAKLSKR